MLDVNCLQIPYLFKLKNLLILSSSLGTIVLFPQGAYKAGQTQLTGGKRWHEGTITNIYTDSDGEKRYTLVIFIKEFYI